MALWLDLVAGRRRLAQLDPGEAFGELSLLDGRERTTTAEAVGPTVLLELDQSDFHALLRVHPEVAVRLLEVLAGRLRRTNLELSDAVSLLKREADWTAGDSEELMPQLPVLDALRETIGGLRGSIGGFVGLQHLMGSTATLVDALVRDRIAPPSICLLGKPYSTNRRVAEFLSSKGYDVHPSSHRQAIEEPHDEALERRVRAVLHTCMERFFAGRPGPTGRVVVIDDGGHAIASLHEPEFAAFLPHCVCVEQTRNGIRRLDHVDLRVPVINVAESTAKLEHESPLIAESVKIELFRELVAIESGGIPLGRRALILGYGAIGRRVAARLHGCGFDVRVFDPSGLNASLAAQHGFEFAPDLREVLPWASLVVGCTGTTSLDTAEYPLIPDGCILVSTSSSDIEFKAWQLRAAGESLGSPRAWQGRAAREGELTGSWRGVRHPCFDLVRVRRAGATFYVVHGGFPVNFIGTVDPIPPRLIQLTRALLYAGAVQASETEQPGLHPLREEWQKIVLEAYLRQADEGMTP